MRWFQHKSSAKSDSQLQRLGHKFGPAGPGIYWGVLEELAKLEAGFQVKLLDISTESDERFLHLLDSPPDANPFGTQSSVHAIPILPPGPLVAMLFTTRELLGEVLDYCASLHLFDRHKWEEYGVVYSPALAEMAAPYTERMARVAKRRERKTGAGEEETCAHTVRTTFEQSSENVPPDQIETKIRLDQKKDKPKRPGVINNLSTTAEEQGEQRDEGFEEFVRDFSNTPGEPLDSTAEEHEWNPTEQELKRLFSGGTRSRAQPAQRGEAPPPQDLHTLTRMALRAIRLKLEQSMKRRVGGEGLEQVAGSG
jgi:hypothetical protein